MSWPLLSLPVYVKSWPLDAINFSIENIGPVPIHNLDQYGLPFQIGFLGIERHHTKSFRPTD